MPELPEVHGYKTYIDSTSLHQKIVGLDCRDERLLKQPFNDFKEHLIGQSLTSTRRIGKYLFLETTGSRVLIMHFGMTGRPNYYKSADDRPQYGHIELSFENGFHFAFENKRKFGWWDLTETIEDYKKEVGLSDDARELTLEQFKDSLLSRKTHIKKVLLDQGVCAGVGNWMADEILYQAQVHPKEKVEDMDQSTIEKVFKAMQEVIETAIKHDAHYSDFPEHYLMHFRKEGANCYHTQGTIEKIKVGGRSTYFSPKWQDK
ncbi:Fpg/Nei family DNA glycosylase [Croceiramulus getboli]|nr:DNA-formamidopyrimidine glycosylase family protein [Flavobacteriaceae bacterium YJPT1-3]